MMETVRIRRSGYPVRRSFEDFLFRYNVLGRHLSPSMADKQRCEAILAQHVTDTQSRDWQPGKTKVIQSNLCTIVLYLMKILIFAGTIFSEN